MRRSVQHMALLGLLLCSAQATAETITRGPFVQDVRLHRADIVWEGTDFGAPMVGYGFASPIEAFAAGICEGVHCYARLEGLSPDSTYTYQLFDGAEPISTPGRVTTAPAVPKNFRFVVYGDNRSDHDAHMMVVQAIVEDVSFIVHSGDLVNSGHYESQWDVFFAIEADLLKNVPIYPAVGNHEVYGGDAAIFERVFHTPEEGSGSPLYYAFSWSNARFLIIDGWVNIVGWYDCLVMGKVQNRCLNPAQEAWVLDELAAIRDDDSIDHVFVVVHEGPYSSKLGRTGSAAMRALLSDFAISKVRMIVSGHDHYYEHGITGNGMHYMISGGGGAPLYASTMQVSDLWPHEILSTMSVHNYQIVEVLGDHVHVTSHDVDHNVILDDFWLGAPAVCVEPGDCVGEQAGACNGDWDCISAECIWSCDAGPPCVTTDDCPPAPVGICPGGWECPFTGECTWACTPLDECLSDADCGGKGALTNCPGGHYACEEMFSVCEWICPPVPTPDVTTEPSDTDDGDVGPSDTDDDAAEDGATGALIDEPPKEDVAPPVPDDEPAVSPQPQTATLTEVSRTSREDSGCAGGTAPPSALWSLLLLAALMHRRLDPARLSRPRRSR